MWLSIGRIREQGGGSGGGPPRLSLKIYDPPVGGENDPTPPQAKTTPQANFGAEGPRMVFFTKKHTEKYKKFRLRRASQFFCTACLGFHKLKSHTLSEVVPGSCLL